VLDACLVKVFLGGWAFKCKASNLLELSTSLGTNLDRIQKFNFTEQTLLYKFVIKIFTMHLLLPSHAIKLVNF